MELKRCGLDLREETGRTIVDQLSTRDGKAMEGRYWEQPQRTWQREEPGRQEHRQLGPVQAPYTPEHT